LDIDIPASLGTDVAATARHRARAIGNILIEDGRLSSADVEKIQRYAIERGIRFGSAAVQLNMLTWDDVDFALASQFKHLVVPRGGENGVADDVVAAYSPQTKGLEALRVLRSELSVRWLKSATRKVLAIVSPERGEGRSWLAANLATMFAHIGQRTLLIDADMRNPRQHQLFNLDNSAGLSALLTGRADRDVAQRVYPQLRLFVITAGIAPPNPQELLARPVFDVVLDRFAEQFDIVLLDTPAAKESSDGQLLAVNAGSAIVLARRNHTLHSGLTAAMKSLTEAGVKVIGSVINEH
jgi:chain length determinant protein tyrosine kinase EpsG